MLDLKKFCSTDSYRLREIGEPWSFDGCSYASNGHIMIRVPLRDGVPERESAPNAKAIRVFATDFNFSGPFTPLGALTLPDGPLVACAKCEGRGKVHACPACSCACVECGGAGSFINDDALSVEMRGATFDGKYARMLLSMPGLLLPVVAGSAADAMPFIFDGGEGLLMPFRGTRAVHIKEIPAIQAAA